MVLQLPNVFGTILLYWIQNVALRFYNDSEWNSLNTSRNPIKTFSYFNAIFCDYLLKLILQDYDHSF